MTSPAGQTGLAEYSLALRAGTMLADQYAIVGVLGRPGGFGITYLAEDIRLESLVAIKEFLPRELATRAPDSTAVVTHSGDGDGGFRHGLEQFLREARTLAKIHHPSVVRVRQFFEANGTAYLVMDYLEGQTLSDLLKQSGGRIPADEAVEIMLRVLDGLRAAHALNIYHRDVKPSNIYITSSGLPVLLDFGAARQATGSTSSKMTAVLTPGFAPLEQYGHRGQGPWTDIYAASAVLYHVITGVDPVPATDRVGEEVDPMLPPADIDPDIALQLSDAIMKGLAMAARSRPQTAEEFQRLLKAALTAPKTTPAVDAQTPAIEPVSQAPSQPPPQKLPSTIVPGVPFVPALADTLGPADIISLKPKDLAVSGPSSVTPIVPSLANTIGPADIARADVPSGPPSAKSPVSAPSLADTVAVWRATPTSGEAVQSSADVETPKARASGLQISDAFIKVPSDREISLRPVSDLAQETETDSPVTEVETTAEDHAPADSGNVDDSKRPSDGFALNADSDVALADAPAWRLSSGIAILEDAPAKHETPSALHQLWIRATDTRQKRIGLAAAAVIVVVASGLFLASGENSTTTAAPAPLAITPSAPAIVAAPAIDSSAIRDSIAADSIQRVDSIAKAVADARRKDSLRNAGTKKQTAVVPPAVVAAAGTPTPTKTDTNIHSAAAADSAKKAQAEAFTLAAEQHLKKRISEFSDLVKSRNNSRLAELVVASERTPEALGEFLKLVREKDKAEATPNGDNPVTTEGKSVVKYQTVTIAWREGKFNRRTEVRPFVIRLESVPKDGGWDDKPIVIAKP